MKTFLLELIGNYQLPHPLNAEITFWARAIVLFGVLVLGSIVYLALFVCAIYA